MIATNINPVPLTGIVPLLAWVQNPNAPLPGANEDYRALNIIIWRDIYRAGNIIRIGNKFFPLNNPQLCQRLDRQFNITHPNGQQQSVTRHIYDARTGYFTSVRPGQGQLLLNINATCSAFFPAAVNARPLNLQEWIHDRWAGAGIPPADESKELKGVKVTFNLDPLPRPKRTIWAISRQTVGQQTFLRRTTPAGGGQAVSQTVTVHTHMQQRK